MTVDIPRAAPPSGMASNNPASRKLPESVELGLDTTVVVGSGNVFADLGLPNPEAELRAADARIAGLAEPVEMALAKLVHVTALAADRHGLGVADALQAVRDAIRAQGPVLPAEMTRPIKEALGQVNFVVGPVAHLLQAAGEPIPEHYESEQAHVLFRFLHFALLHGDGWGAEADRMVAAAKATVEANRKKGDVP